MTPSVPFWRRGAAGRRPRALVAVLVAGALGVVAACSAVASADWRDGVALQSAVLSLSHQADATDVSPADPVVVTVAGGTLDEVVLAKVEGPVLKGEFNEDRTQWTSMEALAYNTQYSVTVKSTGEDGEKVEEARSFTTVKPKNLTMPYLFAFRHGDIRENADRRVNGEYQTLDGHTYGVGQPIIVWFDEPIKDKATAERNLKVTTVPPVLGSWRWVNDQQVRWRPKEYWPAGTQVTVEANVYGKDLGNGLYGQQNAKASFKIGQKKIAIADWDDHYMRVFIDDVEVTEIKDPRTKNTYKLYKECSVKVTKGQETGDQFGVSFAVSGSNKWTVRIQLHGSQSVVSSSNAKIEGNSGLVVATPNGKGNNFSLTVRKNGTATTPVATCRYAQGIPISMGPDRYDVSANGSRIWAKSYGGPHYITLKYSAYRMNSATFGLVNEDGTPAYDDLIAKSIRITGDGEFVHYAPWSEWAQGSSNQSHGCTNVGTKYIYWFFDNFGAGDIVDVVDSSRKMPKSDEQSDWMYTWEEWWKGSALNQTEPVLEPRQPGLTPLP